jgi:hypothetical protein
MNNPTERVFGAFDSEAYKKTQAEFAAKKQLSQRAADRIAFEQAAELIAGHSIMGLVPGFDPQDFGPVMLQAKKTVIARLRKIAADMEKADRIAKP